jgi:L-amino acid N-acyltransferase YncA
VVERAENDPFLKSEGRVLGKSKNKRVLLSQTKKIIGFYTPGRIKINSVNYSMLHAVYLLPSCRGKGIMQEVLKLFFKETKYATVWIEDKNLRSINLFAKLGFEKELQQIHVGKVGHWYILPA